MAASDVLGTGWFATVAAEAAPGKPWPWSATARWACSASWQPSNSARSGSVAISRHEPRQRLARKFGATDIVEERGGEAVVKELTHGLGAHSVIEAVGTQESMMQAIRATRPGGHVGVSHGVTLPGEELFFAEIHLHGGPAPVRRFLPQLIELICHREIDPGKVFDLDLPLEQAAEGSPGRTRGSDRLVATRCGQTDPAHGSGGLPLT